MFAAAAPAAVGQDTVAGAEPGSDSAAGPGAEAGANPKPDAEDERTPEWGRGPLEVRDAFVLAYQRLSPWARSPEVLGHLEVEASVRTTWANSYGFRTGRVLVDAETFRVDTTVRLGLFDRFQVGVTLPVEWRGGGSMDGFLEGFHDAFGLPEGNREKRPRDSYLVTGTESDGSTFELEEKGTAFVDLLLEGRALLTRGGNWIPAATLTLTLRLPTGASRFELSDGVDGTLGIDLAKRLPGLPLVVYAGASYTYHAHTHVADLRMKRHRGFLSLGIELEALEWLSIVLHGWWETQREPYLYKDAKLTHGNYVTYLAAGVKVEPVEGLVLELGMLENVIDPDVTADLALLFNVSFRY